MADIFISYSRADRDRVEPLARALAEQGWSVWWDRQIPPGKTFDEVIEEELEAAQAVVCVWTASGVSSRWVRTEAEEGEARGILVPVLLQKDVKISLAFRRIQAADLSDWDPGNDHAGFDELLMALRGLIQTGETAPDQSPTSAAGSALLESGASEPPTRETPDMASGAGPGETSAAGSVDDSEQPERTATEGIPSDRESEDPELGAAAGAAATPDAVDPELPAGTLAGPKTAAGESVEAETAPRVEPDSANQQDEPAAVGRAPEKEPPTRQDDSAPAIVGAEPESADQHPAREDEEAVAGVAAPAATSGVRPPTTVAGDRSSGPTSNKALIAAGTAVAAAALVIGVFAFAGGGGDDPTTTIAGASTTASTSLTTTSVSPTTSSIPPTTLSTDSQTAETAAMIELLASPLPELLPAPACADMCATIDSIVLDRNAMVVDWTAEAFVPDTNAFHAHFFWNDISPEEAGTNAAAFGATSGDWELTDQQPFRSSKEMRLSQQPSGADSVCVTVANTAHGVVDPAVFECALVPSVYEDLAVAFTDPDEWEHELALSGTGEPIVGYLASTGSEDEVRVRTSGETVVLDAAFQTNGLLAIDALPSGEPVVGYTSAGSVKLATCTDAECSDAAIIDLDAAGADDMDVAVGSDGNTLVAYYDTGRRQLRLVHCLATTCTTQQHHFLSAARSTAVLDHVDIGIGGNEFPIVTYSPSPGSLDLLICNDLACSEASPVSIADDARDIPAVSLMVNDSGLPVISYISESDMVTVVECLELSCAQRSTSQPLPDRVDLLSSALGEGGYPIIAASTSVEDETLVGFCGSPDCTSATWVTYSGTEAKLLDLVSPSVGPPSLSHGSEDGLTVIALS